jgi:hypothetical protein
VKPAETTDIKAGIKGAAVTGLPAIALTTAKAAATILILPDAFITNRKFAASGRGRLDQHQGSPAQSGG